MSVSADPLLLFSEKSGTYDRFIHATGYPRGLRAYFERSGLLRPGLHVLDAGCGTGVVTLAVHDACLRRGFAPPLTHAFDLTPAMLDRFRRTLGSRGITQIELAQADVLALGQLPSAWDDYDLVVSASMMEYLPRTKLPDALRGLRGRLRPDGTLILFITRRNWLTRPLIGRWWQSNLYTADELRVAFRDAGFATAAFRRFPFPFHYLDSWGYIVEASARA